MNTTPHDSYNRPLHDLRISVTDRCNFRCNYCMPKSVFGKNYRYLRRADLLSYEEVERVARIFIDLGVRKIRLTGGEPLLRHDLEKLIVKLAALPGLEDIALTTNASLLTEKRVALLRDSGVNRLNISLDALDETVYRDINEIDYPIQDVLDGIDNAMHGDFASLKINVVVQKGVNENQILPLAEYFRGKPVILRFIEFMDVGTVSQWDMSRVVTAQQIIDIISGKFPLTALNPNYTGEVASRWSYQDGCGEVGVISSVSKPFCQDCSRARLSAIGELFTCLFASEGFDIRRRLREDDLSDRQLSDKLTAIWSGRSDRYSEMRQSGVLQTDSQKVEMSYIGG